MAKIKQPKTKWTDVILFCWERGNNTWLQDLTDCAGHLVNATLAQGTELGESEVADSVAVFPFPLKLSKTKILQ